MLDAAPLLPDDVLALRAQLPQKPAPVIIEGRYVTLRPVDIERDATTLFAISNGSPITRANKHIEAYDNEALIWRWMASGPFADQSAFNVYLQALLDGTDNLPFTVFERDSDQPVGVATYMRNFPQHLSIELGNIWYSPIAQRTNANLEATYLMLRHAFDLGYRRLEWKCDNRNERSKRSALRMGFVFEGVQEAHFIIKNRNRDTAWFRILDGEWHTVKTQLETLLA
jgi:RimJ/RimL family protein N-acetyltransferase